MLRSIKELIGYYVLAQDGKIGHVEDFYFNDEHWIIRYLIVDIGIWIFGRKVLVSTSSFIKDSDWSNRNFQINLTKEQIKDSPDIASDKPVSIQKEEDIVRYYNLPIYWTTGVPVFYSYAIPFEKSGSDNKDSEEELEKENNESHLRSVNELLGYNLIAEDDEIGAVEDFLADDESWLIKYIIIYMKKILPGKKVFINFNSITNISWQEKRMYINITIEEIKNSPEYDPYKTINREYERMLNDYFEKSRYLKR